MNSTNRRAKGEEIRDPRDFYATPKFAARAILRLLPRTPGFVLEPGCGTGNILDVLRDSGRDPLGIEVDSDLASQARARGHKVVEADFLNFRTNVRFALIVGNPPYRLAMKFLRRAMELVTHDGTIAFLLRLGFAESIGRANFHREHAADIKVFPRRPSFCVVKTPCRKCSNGVVVTMVSTPTSFVGPDGKSVSATSHGAANAKCKRCGGKGYKLTRTDSAAYSWWIWGPQARGTWTVLPVTDDMLHPPEDEAPTVIDMAQPPAIALPPEAEIEMIEPQAASGEEAFKETNASPEHVAALRSALDNMGQSIARIQDLAAPIETMSPESIEKLAAVMPGVELAPYSEVT